VTRHARTRSSCFSASPNLPALREIGFSANWRLLGAGRLSHNPIRAAEAFTAVNDPLITDTGTRIPGLRFTDRRAQALLHALLMFRLLPHGFANRDLRALLAPLLGLAPGTITAGQMSYDLRRLRGHGLITRVPGSHRYRVTDTGLHHAMLLTHIHTRLLQPGLAALTDPDPPLPTPLRTAARNYQRALDQLTQAGGRTRRMTPNLTRSYRLRRSKPSTICASCAAKTSSSNPVDPAATTCQPRPPAPSPP